MYCIRNGIILILVLWPTHTSFSILYELIITNFSQEPRVYVPVLTPFFCINRCAYEANFILMTVRGKLQQTILSEEQDIYMQNKTNLTKGLCYTLAPCCFAKVRLQA